MKCNFFNLVAATPDAMVDSSLQSPMVNHCELRESDIRPREIPSPEDSVFLANMRSHQKVFHRLAEFGKMLREPGANFLGGVENDLRSTENSQNESHLQDHLDERMTPHLQE